MSWWKRESTATTENTQKVQGLKAHIVSALDSAQTALMMVDRDFKVFYVNNKSMELLLEGQLESIFL